MQGGGEGHGDPAFGLLSLSPAGKPETVEGSVWRPLGLPQRSPAHQAALAVGFLLCLPGDGHCFRAPGSLTVPCSVAGTSLAIPLYGNEGFLYFVPQFLSQASAPPVLLLFMCGCLSHFITHWLHPMLTGRAWARATINISLSIHMSHEPHGLLSASQDSASALIHASVLLFLTSFLM